MEARTKSLSQQRPYRIMQGLGLLSLFSMAATVCCSVDANLANLTNVFSFGAFGLIVGAYGCSLLRKSNSRYDFK